MWLAGCGLATVYGLTAAPASFAQQPVVCPPPQTDGCVDYEFDREKGGVCPSPDPPQVCVEAEANIGFVECALDFHPSSLDKFGRDTQAAILKQCVLLDARGTFTINVADVLPATIRLHACDKWPDCLDDPANFNAFQDKGLSPKTGLRQCSNACKEDDDRRTNRPHNEFTACYDEQALYRLVCGNTSVRNLRTLAVLGQVGLGAKATDKNGKTVDVSGIFLRGMDLVECRPKIVWSGPTN
jgi:hypothetical protein